jgi:hypothetical protein
MGSGTGRGAGYCSGAGAPGFASAPGFGGQGRGFGGGGFVRGCGRGRGRGFQGFRRFGQAPVQPAQTGFVPAGVPQDPEEERRALKRQTKAMRDAVAAVEDRLSRLENQADQG